ncbi:ty3-gypsy retroelement polyprotein [Tanacetum coccineum]
MVELKNLKQITTVQLYQEQFEALMNKVELSEAYAVSLFIGGLKDDISMSFRMFKPNTLTDVNVTYPPKSTTTTLALPVPTTAKPAYVQPRKQLTQKEIADKRAKNLCFYCDEKFVLGHKCSGQLFSLEICADSSNSEEYELEALLEEPLTMRVKAYVGKHTVHSLIDYGSTHTFLDLRVAKKLGCKLRATCPMDVSVAYHEMCCMNAKASTGSSQGNSRPQNSLTPKHSPNQYQTIQTPPSQKDVVEAMVKELMESGVIRDSQSPYSSPIVMLVLQTMKQNSLYAKMSKYIFATTQVPWSISGKGVSTDPSKIITMQKWPTPVNVKHLRGFLGLTGYYRRFIKDYASISKPLTLLLKKNSFVWNPNAQTAFETLKEAMSQAPVLALPNFNKPFTVETDALGMGIGAVLQQGGHPIAYLSKFLSSKHQALSAYEKKLYAVLMALLTTPFQAKWLPKLLGYDYEISYKKGSENYVVDALYMISNGSELCSLVLSTVSSDLLQQIKSSWEKDVDLQLLIKQIADHTYTGMKKFIKKFMSECNVCQRNKPDLSASPGYLQPLPIPTKVWHDISMDFIEALPPSQGKTVLFVVVDRLSKYAHFIPMSHPFTASQVSQAFMDNVYKLHGMPNTIVSDRDKIFISQFWQSLFKVMKVQLNLSTAYHPQIDGQTEVVNKCVECFMRCMTGEKPKEWVKWVSLAEYWYNTNYHSSAHTTPFEVVYGQPPSLHLSNIAGTSSLEEVAYKLQLPEDSQIHPVFHVSQLKLCKGTNHQVSILPHCGPDGVLSMEPEAIIGRRLGKLNKKVVLYVLVKWVNQTEEDATWELYTNLIQRFPQMELHS